MVSVMGKQLIPVGYKQTEVGVIPADWELSTIGQNTHWMSGGTPSRKNEAYWSGKIPWISGSTLKTFEISTSDQFLTEAAVDSGSKMAPLNSTLLLVRGSALHNEIRAGLVVAPVSFNQDVKALVPIGTVEPKYLTWYLLGMNNSLLKLVSSAGNSAGVLDTELVQNFNFLKPPKVEQTAIANALSDVDALIAALESLINKKSAIKTAAMQQLLTGKKRLSPFDQLNTGYRQTELGEIPGDWEVHSMSEIAHLERGKFSARPRNDPKFFNGNIPFIQTGDITRANGKDVGYTQTLNEEGVRVSRVFQKDTLFFTIAANIGDVAIVPYSVACPDSLVAIITRPHINKYWLLQVLKDRKKEFELLATSNAQLNLNLEKLNPYLLAVPSNQEQTAIANVLSDMDKDLEALHQRLHKTQQIKQGMMQELLTGKTRLVEPQGGPNA